MMMALRAARTAIVANPDRPPWFLTLNEAIAIALENGTVGIENVLSPGTANDLLGGFATRNVQSADGIRVLAFDPAIVANDIEASLSKFDTIWNTALTDSQIIGLAAPWTAADPTPQRSIQGTCMVPAQTTNCSGVPKGRAVD